MSMDSSLKKNTTTSSKLISKTKTPNKLEEIIMGWAFFSLFSQQTVPENTISSYDKHRNHGMAFNLYLQGLLCI